MSDDDEARIEGPRHLIRPRWTWGGLLGMLLGLGILAGGVIALSVTWSVVGTVVLVLAAGAAWHGGLLYDTSGHISAGVVARRLEQGETFEAPDPTDRGRGGEIVEHGLEAEGRRHDSIEKGARASRSLLRLGGLLVVGSGAWFLLSQWAIYPATATGRAGGLRALAAGVVLGLAGLRLLTTGRSVVWSGLAALAGAVMVVVALSADHDAGRSTLSELVVGLVALAGALMSFDPGRGSRSPT